MSGATHLQNRLDAQDIEHIFALKAQGISNSMIALRYKLSYASVARILSGLWNRKQVAAWGDHTEYMHGRDSLPAFPERVAACRRRRR